MAWVGGMNISLKVRKVNSAYGYFTITVDLRVAVVQDLRSCQTSLSWQQLTSFTNQVSRIRWSVYGSS